MIRAILFEDSPCVCCMDIVALEPQSEVIGAVLLGGQSTFAAWAAMHSPRRRT